MPDRYLQINDDVGVDPDGNLEPAVEIGLAVNVPTMKNGEVVDIANTVRIAPIPGTRIFKFTDPVHFAAGLAGGALHEVEAPSKADLDKGREETTEAREAAGTREEG